MSHANFLDRITPAARITNTILLAFIINLISTEVSAHTKWEDIPAKLGWWVLLIPTSLALLLLDYRSTERLDRRAHDEQARLRLLFQELQTKMLKHLFELMADAALYPKREGSLNMHVFLARPDINGRYALMKERRFYYEREHMPSNFSLDVVYPDEDNLVICDAYNRNTFAYKTFEGAAAHQYNPRLQGKVDPAIHWVLACPLHIDNKPPLGVLCAFGAKPFITSKESLRYFQDLMIKTSEIVVWMLQFNNNFYVDSTGGPDASIHSLHE
jgi:hypothetical protein